MTFTPGEQPRDAAGKFGEKIGGKPETRLVPDFWSGYRAARDTTVALETQALANTVRERFPTAERAYFETMGDDEVSSYLAVSLIEDADGKELWESGHTDGGSEFLDALNQHAINFDTDELLSDDTDEDFLYLPPAAELDADTLSEAWEQRRQLREMALQSNKENLAQKFREQFPTASRLYVDRSYEGGNVEPRYLVDGDGATLWELDSSTPELDETSRVNVMDFCAWELDGDDEDYIELPVSLADERTWPSKAPF